jgi:predicted transcriptional regulator
VRLTHCIKTSKNTRLTWLTSRRMAGEAMTKQEVEEAFRLFEEVNGKTMGEVHREMQEEKARGESEPSPERP